MNDPATRAWNDPRRSIGDARQSMFERSRLLVTVYCKKCGRHLLEVRELSDPLPTEWERHERLLGINRPAENALVKGLPRGYMAWLPEADLLPRLTAVTTAVCPTCGTLRVAPPLDVRSAIETARRNGKTFRARAIH